MVFNLCKLLQEIILPHSGLKTRSRPCTSVILIDLGFKLQDAKGFSAYRIVDRGGILLFVIEITTWYKLVVRISGIRVFYSLTVSISNNALFKKKKEKHLKLLLLFFVIFNII